MKLRTTIKRHPLVWIFLLILLMLLFLLGIKLLQYRKDINNTEVLRSYRIQATDDERSIVDLLQKISKEKLSVKLQESTARSHLFLRMASSTENAEAFGFSLDGYDKDGYLITRQGNGLYLLSPSPEGLSRACYRLVFDLTDSNGSLSLALNERFVDLGQSVNADLSVGTTPLQDYTIVCPKNVPLTYANLLSYYMNQSCCANPNIVTEDPSDAAIFLSVDPYMEDANYEVKAIESNIYIRGSSVETLPDGIYDFANTYLGWMSAGTDAEKLSAKIHNTSIPTDFSTASEAWIAEREPIITLWNVNYSRGTFLNSSTSLKTDILSFSEEQLYEYVKMMKYCGYTGIQVTDMCSAWSGAGSYEYVHERLRILANAAHSLGMNFTLWVWGAEFTGYGWVDNSVTYDPAGNQYAYENPKVIESFEKYYSIYAELADCCDRVIAHFYDPGNLDQAEDIAYFSKMLRDKLIAVNPNIYFGISCWVDKYDKKEFVNALGNGITLYESGHHDNPDDYNAFRSFCVNTGCAIGTWAWNTCEMEIDQLAQMNYNPHIIRSVYQTAKQYDSVAKPQYWSEMDSNHIINIFSLYCAAQLLINPDLDPEELTKEISVAAVGEEYADAFADILKLIEDARSGYSWDTYFWSNEDYILKNRQYPAEEIQARSTKALETLQQMINNNVQANSLPLPIPLTEVLQLMMPQIEQIKSFSEFRIGLSEANEMMLSGVASEEVQKKIDTLTTPVSEYNTIVGLWGQVEARAQYEMLSDFCEKYGFDFSADTTFRQAQKNRIYDYFCSYQKGKDSPVLQYPPYFQYGVAYGYDTTIQLVNELIEEGLFSVDENGSGVYVTDWEHYKYAFN